MQLHGGTWSPLKWFSKREGSVLRMHHEKAVPLPIPFNLTSIPWQLGHTMCPSAYKHLSPWSLPCRDGRPHPTHWEKTGSHDLTILWLHISGRQSFAEQSKAGQGGIVTQASAACCPGDQRTLSSALGHLANHAMGQSSGTYRIFYTLLHE